MSTTLNSLDTASRYTSELDKMFVQKSVTGFLADNALRAKFVGAKSVIIPNIEFAGLQDYDRDAGFAKGATTVDQDTYTLSQDRARQLQLDSMDMDETGIANLSGQVLGEFVRTKVVPECDAYILSKLAGIALTDSQAIDHDDDTPYADFISLVDSAREECGYDEELVCFMDIKTYSTLCSSSEVSKQIMVSDFKKGEVNLKVKTIDGVVIIPVPSAQMKSGYTFNDTAAGGYTALSTAKSINMMVMPKNGASLVKKTEKLRIFTPEQNSDIDGYKFNYRIYYDVFAKKSQKGSIWVAKTDPPTQQGS